MRPIHLQPQSRQFALRAVSEAPDGYYVNITEGQRGPGSNALMWVLLECFSEQLEWPVNGAMTKLEPVEWKDIMTAAFDNEHVRLAQGLNGGVVMLGHRTSRYTKSKMSEFIDWLYAEGANRDVVFDKEVECANP